MKWYYTDGTRNAGPYSERAMRELREAGLIKGDTWVRPEDSETWSAFDKAIGESSTETHTETAATPPQNPPIPEIIAPQQDDLAAMLNALATAARSSTWTPSRAVVTGTRWCAGP